MKIKEYHLKANYPSAFIHIPGVLIEQLPLQGECTDVFLITLDDNTAKEYNVTQITRQYLNEGIGSFEFLSDEKVQIERSAQLTGIKWKILKEDEAAKYHLQLVNIDNDNTLLQIDVKDIPMGLSNLDFIEMLEKTGVIRCDKAIDHD